MSLQGAWNFNENTGVLAGDVSGNGRNLTGVPGWSGAGHTGSAMLVDGVASGARLDVPDQFYFTDSSTFMCWVRLNTLKAGDIMNGPRYGSTGRWGISVSAAGVLSAWTGGGSGITGPTLQAGVWYHIAFAFDWAQGGQWDNCVLYVDGQSVGTDVGFPMGSGEFYWGGSTSSINGLIDDARWDSSQLSQAQIQAYMTKSVPGPLESSGATRFIKSSNGTWQPVYTQALVGSFTPPAYGWELTVANSGLNKFGIDGRKLPLYNGPTKPAAGTVIRGKRIETMMDLSEGNITLEKCFIRPKTVSIGISVISIYDRNGDKIGAGPVTIKDCTIDGSLLELYPAAMSCGIIAHGTITGNLVSGFGSGIAMMGTGTSGNSLVEHNYVRGLVGWGDPATDGNHSDGFTIRDFSAAVDPSRTCIVRNNRFDCSSPNSTGAFFTQTYAGRIDNVHASGNLLEGLGYTMALEHLNHPYSNITATNNRFAGTGIGNSYVSGGSGYASWADNYRYDPDLPNSAGSPVNPS